MGVKWRRFRTAAGWVAFLALAAVNLDALIVQWCVPAPPPRPKAPILGESLRSEGPLRRLGPCWSATHRGQHVVYLEGDPFTLGYCNSRLLGAVMDRQEQTLVDKFRELVPLGPLRHLLIRGLMVAYRDLPRRFTEAERLEVLGLASGREDRFGWLGPTYGRILSYHAIHDISQALIDNPLFACSAFAASHDRTRDGHTLLARNFDFEGGAVFDEDKVVAFVRPDVGFPFVSVAWAGMVGAVSGMNARGIGVVLNAAASDDRDRTGRPSTLVVRDILQGAGSLGEAIAIVRHSDVLVADLLTVADGKTGELAVLEVTPKRVLVRTAADRIVATNHFLHPDASRDRKNALRMRDGTTVARWSRLTELVEAAGPLDPPSAVAILRDRRGPGGASRAPGHRGTIDALIATHSVVFDLTARRLWVSAAPHTLGPFVQYDLDEVLRRGWRDRGALPPDAMLADGRWDRTQRARALLSRAGQLADDGRHDSAIRLVREALDLVPDHPEGLLRLARICDDAGRPDCARQGYGAFLAADPPYRRDADFARARLAALLP